jgi:hypothetical protein
MEIQPLQHNDLPLIPTLLPPGWDSAIPAIQFYTTSAFCFPIKVSVDGKMVGTGTTIIHHDVAWLAHILVHADHRNQGIGQLVTKTLIDIATSKNCDTLYLLATELGEPVYRKFGFETETEYVFLKSERLLDSAFHDDNIIPYSNAYEKQIELLDRQVSGEDRLFHLQQHLSNGLVYVVDNRVEGFYLPTMGDGLIVATTNTAGQSLMRLRLATKDFAVYPIDNLLAAAFIQQHPFTEIRRQKRMRLGKLRNWQPTNIYNRIGGNLG